MVDISFMKKRSLIAILALFASSAIAEDTKEQWRLDAERAVIEANKGTVMDAFSSQPLSFWVTMRDDGSRRDGFAEYVCLEISDYKPSGQSVVVTIWDGIAMSRGDFLEIGKAVCPD